MNSSLPAAKQKGDFETTRKLDMVLEWLSYQAKLKARANSFGRMQIELVWERGCIKRVKIVDEIIIEDMTDKERELILRHDSIKSAQTS